MFTLPCRGIQTRRGKNSHFLSHCLVVTKTFLSLLDQDGAIVCAQVGSRGNERDECYPVDFNAPRGLVDLHATIFIDNILSKVYEKFDYNDLECQKKLICEVMREPEYFGNMSAKLKSGFQ